MDTRCFSRMGASASTQLDFPSPPEGGVAIRAPDCGGSGAKPVLRTLARKQALRISPSFVNSSSETRGHGDFITAGFFQLHPSIFAEALLDPDPKQP